MRYLLTGLVTTCALWLLSCSDSIVSDPAQIVFPDSLVSFQRQVQPFIGLSCARSGCHNQDSRAGGVELAFYTSLITVPGLVLPGNPDGSLLVQLLEDRVPHSFAFQATTNDNHRRGIRQWIREGARNN